MNSATDNFLKLRGHRPIGQKKYFNVLNVDKENIEQENRMPILEIARKVTLTPTSNYRGRKNSDNSFDRTQRSKGLQVSETDTSNNYHSLIPRRRIHSASSDTSENKLFAKHRFTIYNDTLNTDHQTAGKVVNFKQNGTERSTKSLGLRESARGNLQIPLQKNRENNGKLSVPGSGLGKVKVSPNDLPQIPQPNVSKIKKDHKKAPLGRKTPQAVYDVLSLDLAYNIDYMSEFLRFQMEISEKKKLSPSFLTRGVTANQRRLIVKYLIRCATYHRYPSFILYQTVKIFDSYVDTVDVEVYELQTVALAALWIELKRDLMIDDVPNASDIIELAGPLFEGDKKPLIECEKKILMSLNFEISFADPFSMLALYTVMVEEVRDLKASTVQDLYYCGSYLIDLSLLHDKMFDISAMHLAAISAEIALVLIMTSDENLNNPQWLHWRNRVFMANPTLEKYRLSDSYMNYIRNQLLQKVVLSKDSSTDFFIVYKKYNTKRYGPVSNFLVSKISSLFVQRIMDPTYSAHPILF